MTYAAPAGPPKFEAVPSSAIGPAVTFFQAGSTETDSPGSKTPLPFEVPEADGSTTSAAGDTSGGPGVRVAVGVKVGGPGVGVRVGVAVEVGVRVKVRVEVGVGVPVAVRVAVAVGVRVAVNVAVGVIGVAVSVGVTDAVNVGVAVAGGIRY